MVTPSTRTSMSGSATIQTITIPTCSCPSSHSGSLLPLRYPVCWSYLFSNMLVTSTVTMTKVLCSLGLCSECWASSRLQTYWSASFWQTTDITTHGLLQWSGLSTLLCRLGFLENTSRDTSMSFRTRFQWSYLPWCTSSTLLGWARDYSVAPSRECSTSTTLEILSSTCSFWWQRVTFQTSCSQPIKGIDLHVCTLSFIWFWDYSWWWTCFWLSFTPILSLGLSKILAKLSKLGAIIFISSL